MRWEILPISWAHWGFRFPPTGRILKHVTTWMQLLSYLSLSLSFHSLWFMCKRRYPILLTDQHELSQASYKELSTHLSSCNCWQFTNTDPHPLLPSSTFILTTVALGTEFVNAIEQEGKWVFSLLTLPKLSGVTIKNSIRVG